MLKMATKELTAFTPENDCDQTVEGLLPVTFAVFLQVILVKLLGGISEMVLWMVI
jgi:hypothetical protein